MTYSSLPNSGQSLGQTRDGIRTNFNLIRSTVDQNHVDFDLANAGKHTCVQIPVLAAIPANPIPPGGLVAGEATIYAKTSGGESQLFATPDASGNEYQMSAFRTGDYASFGNYTNYAPPVANQNGGWTFLPGGLILQYGEMKSTGATTPVVFPIAFSSPPYAVTATRAQSSSANSAYGIPTTSATGFNFASTSSAIGIIFQWTAIGK